MAAVLITVQNLTVDEVSARLIGDGEPRKLATVDFGNKLDDARVTLLDEPDALRAVLTAALDRLDEAIRADPRQ